MSSIITTTPEPIYGRNSRATMNDAEDNGIRDPSTRQAEININFKPDYDGIKQRSANLKKLTPGNVIPGGNESDNNFRSGDIFVTTKSALRNTGKDFAPVFVNLGGFDISRYESSEDLDEELVTVGLCYLDKGFKGTFNGPMREDIPVGAQVVGSGPIINKIRGRKPMIVGQRYMVKSPYWNRREGTVPNQKWLLENKYSKSEHNNRITMELVEYEPALVGSLNARMYRMIIDDLGRAGKMGDPKYVPTNRHFNLYVNDSFGMEKLDRMSASYLAQMQATLLSGVHVLQKRGIVKVLTPETKPKQILLENMAKQLKEFDLNSSSAEDALELITQWKKSLEESTVKTDPHKSKGMLFEDYVSENGIEVSTETSPFEIFDFASSQEEIMEREKAQLWLASRLGFITNKPIPTGYGNVSSANVEWLQDFVHCYFYGKIPKDGSASMAMRGAYSPEMKTSPGKGSNNTSIEKQYEKAIEETPDICQGLINDVYDRTVQSVKCVALRSGAPMESGEVLWRIASK